MNLKGFQRMVTAWSRGNGDHLPPMKTGEGFFITETQADNLRHELLIEEMDSEEVLWVECAEEGLVNVPTPPNGKMMRVRITGQAQLFVNAAGVIVVDPRGY